MPGVMGVGGDVVGVVGHRGTGPGMGTDPGLVVFPLYTG